MTTEGADIVDQLLRLMRDTKDQQVYALADAARKEIGRLRDIGVRIGTGEFAALEAENAALKRHIDDRVASAIRS